MKLSRRLILSATALAVLSGCAQNPYDQSAQTGQGTGVEVQRQGDNIQLIMPGNITFATDSADISSGFYNPLNNLASSFKQYDQNSIEIVGHTDSTGGYQYNMGLSQRRAQSVANYLVSQGVNPSRVTTRGAGPDQPVASNNTESGRQQNRRVAVSYTHLTLPTKA